MKNSFILTPYFLDESVPGLELLIQPDWQINKPVLPPGAAKQGRMTELHRPLAGKVSEALKRGERPVSIAGDCCTSLGVLAGIQAAGINPTLIWFDAHGDFNTWETTPSGFLGGMPLAMLVGRGDQTMVEGVELTPLPEAQVVLTDARDLDPGEREAVAGSAMTHLPDTAVLLDAPLPDGPLYVHFDVDVVNVNELPTVSYPAPDGPSVALLGQVFRRLAQTGRVTAVSVSAWNPDLDTDSRSRAAAMNLLAELVASN